VAMAHDAQQIPGTLSNLQLSAVVSALDGLGLDADRVLGEIGLDRTQIADPAGRVAAGIEFPLWRSIVEISGDLAIGMRMGERISFDALGGYGYLLQNSETFEQLLGRASKFMRLIDDLFFVELSVEGERAFTRWGRTGGYAIPDPGIDCVLTAVACATRHAIGPDVFAEGCLRIAHPSPLGAAVYERYIGCRVELDADTHEFEAPRAWLALRPDRSANPKLGDVLQQHATHLLEGLPEADAIVQTARTNLLAQLGQGDLGLASLARAMRMSERTLRRRLSERGTSYQTLLDELRAEQARKWVGSSSDPVDQIAQRLGFADTSSFFHAFKRWTGQTPTQFRRGLRG
jgi:AraC-like DNA-binding protein